MKSKNVIPMLLILIILIVKIFVIDIARVQGNSMNPTLKNNDLLLYSKINNKYSRFDIIIIQIDNKYVIKRIVGLPGESIEYSNGKLLVNKKNVIETFKTTKTNDFVLHNVTSYRVIPKNKYFVLGDNRQDSYDSRNYGLIDISDIKGKIIAKF